MDADQDVVPHADVPLHQRDVRLPVDDALVSDDPEVPVGRRQRCASHSLHERFGTHAVLNEVCDGDHEQLVPLREARQLRHACHGPVVIHDFADDTRRVEPRNAREVHGGFGLPGSNQHASGAGLQREHVAGARQV